MFEYQKQNLANSKRMRRKMTPWERKLWLFFLRDFQYHIYKQRPIKNYIVDFYCAKAKIAIEPDGSGHYTEENIAKDKERTSELESLGIKVLRYSNRDVDTNFDAVCESIRSAIEERVKK